MEYVLVIDCGTQSVRALIFDKHGVLAAKTKIGFEYPFEIRDTGYYEVPAETFWEGLCRAIRGLDKNILAKVGAVTLTTQRNTYIALDKDKRPVRPAILWMDERLARNPKPYSPLAGLAFSVAGMTHTMNKIRQVAKSNWLRENEPENWARTQHYVLLSGYLNYKLTGKLVDSVANQVGYLPFNYKHKKWMSKWNIKQEAFNIEADKLIPLQDVGTLIGHISAFASAESAIPQGLPFYAAGADKSCETLGTGAITENVASLSFGTTATVQLTTKKYVEPILFFPAYPSLVPNRYNPEIQYFRGYWMVSWFLREFAAAECEESARTNIPAEVLLEKLLFDTEPGANGLMLRPLWGAGVDAPQEKGVIIGFSSNHKRSHIYRAIIEGIAFALRDSMEHLERRARTKIEYATVSGGGSQSDIVCQITSDIIGVPLKRIQTYETSGLGAAISAFVAEGIYSNHEDAIAEMVRYTKTFSPNPANLAIYNKIYKKVYIKLRKRMRPINNELHKLFPTW